MSDLEILKELSKENAKRYLKRQVFVNKITEPIRILQEYKLIDVAEKIYVKCINRSDEDFLQLNEDQKSCSGRIYLQSDTDILPCSECNRLVELNGKILYSNYKLSLNYQRIIELLKLKLCSYQTKISDDGAHISFIDKEEIEHTICLIDICDKLECRTSFYIDNKQMYVACDIVELVDIPNFFWLYDFLIMDQTKLVVYIQTHTMSPKDEKTEQILNDYIDNKTWQQFENIITKLLNLVSESSENYKKGIGVLEKYSGKFCSSITFPIGGSSSPDALSIGILEYYNILFKNNITFEYKHSDFSNIETVAITLNDFRELLNHSKQGNGVLITNRKKIHGSVINECRNYMQINGYWKYIVINRPLLKLFLYLFLPDFYENPDSYLTK